MRILIIDDSPDALAVAKARPPALIVVPPV